LLSFLGCLLGVQWILEELRRLRELFLKNVRRLLHLLSTIAHEAYAQVLSLLKKCYKLLFSDTPARVHRVMVDFNRWLATVLDDTSAESIQWGPSLEEEQPQGHPMKELFASHDASTVELLRAACEHYMARCERLQETNADLTTQVKGLKTQLTEALARAFASRRALDREKELAALQGRRVVERLKHDDGMALPEPLQNTIAADSNGTCEITVEAIGGDSMPAACDVHHGDSEEEGEEFVGGAHDQDAEGAGRVSREDTLSTLASEDEEPPLLEVFVPSKVDVDAESGVDFKQLTRLNSGKDTGGRWYRQALRSLQKGHKQHRLHREHEKATKKASLFGTREFELLVATRDPSQDGEDLTWYRRALQHLKHERKTRESLRRLESFSSTISFVE
jgi:hypothetical protein